LPSHLRARGDAEGGETRGRTMHALVGGENPFARCEKRPCSRDKVGHQIILARAKRATELWIKRAQNARMDFMQNKTIIGLIITVLVAGGVWYFASTKQEAQFITVKISDRGLASALPIYVALEKGYFAKYNLKPELVKFTAGNDVLNALITNQIDIGEMPIDPLVFAEDKTNTDTKIFLAARWSENENRSFDALFVRKGGSIESLANLEGKKIGVFPGITAKTFLAHYLVKNNVNVQKTEFVELAPNVQLQSLTSGAIDALFAYQPTVTIAEKILNLKKIDESIYNKLGFNYFATYAFSGAFSKSDAAGKTQEAFLEAIHYMQSNESDSRQILAKHTALGDISLQMSYFPQYHAPTSEDVKGMSNFVEFYRGKGLIKSVFSNEKIASLIYTP
jgi:ABC-type nitrate/sulfonate/bicarbonate transport system substrate-binding protein